MDKIICVVKTSLGQTKSVIYEPLDTYLYENVKSGLIDEMIEHKKSLSSGAKLSFERNMQFMNDIERYRLNRKLSNEFANDNHYLAKLMSFMLDYDLKDNNLEEEYIKDKNKVLRKTYIDYRIIKRMS